MWLQSIQYELVQWLGEGGQGRVFKALRRDRRTGLCETVALKVLHSETAVELWRHEFESLRRMRSPFCVQVLSFDRFRGRPALVLEYVDGVSLTQLGRSCILDDADIDEILAQIEAALKDLFAAGIYHGDLSPGNALVDRTGSIKLLDFGLANSGGNEARLTPEFAAPERLSGQAPTLATDLYSLGAIESFLRGRLLTEKDTPHYLATDPARRRCLNSPSRPAARAGLAKKIHLWQKRASWAQKFKTKTLQAALRAPRLRGGLWRIVSAMACLLFLPTASPLAWMPAQPPVATLVIRTLRWHSLALNGRALGYPPVTVTVPAEQNLVLSWVHAAGGGRKTLRARTGQRIVMGDRDFTP